MGSEQSQHQQGVNPPNHSQSQSNSVHGTPKFPQRPMSVDAAKLQRGYTIASTSDNMNNSQLADTSPVTDSRPVSPPMSVCSDSDLPYISYTNNPIGDSPKLRNKGQKFGKNNRANNNLRRQTTQSSSYQSTSRQNSKLTKSGAHTLVVVNKANTKEAPIERDPDLVRLQSIPMFLPVMRGSLSLPVMRDPEVLERLQTSHVYNMCSRLQSHYNLCATKVGQDQISINNKIKEVDQDITKLLNRMQEKQKQHANYAETFSKVRQISQQLSRCNSLLNQNIELMEALNNMLDVEERIEPFVWTTN